MSNVKKGADILIDLLKQHEVEYIHGIPGATEVLFMNALENNPEIKFILSLNEIVCVGASEGYARAKNKPSVLYLHTAPGLAAATPLLLNARYGKVPMVIFVGQNDSRLLGKDPQLSGDIAGIAKPIVKWATEIYNVEDIPTVVNRAFKMAMQAPMGPVVVSIPYDLLDEEMEYVPRELPKYGYRAGRGDLEMINYAADLIKAAKNPVLFVQEGVARSRAQKNTIKFAELAGAKVHQVWMGDINFPTSHPLYAGDIDSTSPKMAEVISESDLLIGVGCQLFNDAFYSDIKMPIADKKIIHIDDDPWEIGKNFDVDCGIQGDINSILEEINVILEKDDELKAKSAEKMKVMAEAKAEKMAGLKKKIEEEHDRCPVAISALMSELNKCVDENTYIVDDCWSSSGLLRDIVELKEETQLYRPRNGGSIGFGLPGCLGVKLACPEKDVIAVSGDGSAAWSMQTFWTAAHYNIPVTIVITNNGTYRQVKNVRKRISGDYPLNERHLGMEIDNPRVNFVKLAESMGVDGCQVEKIEDLEAAIKKGKALGKPYVVEVFVENRPD